MRRGCKWLAYALVAVVASIGVLALVVTYALTRERSAEEVAEANARAERRRVIEAEARRLRAREIFSQYFEGSPDEVEDLDGFCHFLLDAGECELTFASNDDVVLKEAWRFSPVSCAEIRDPPPSSEHEVLCSWDAERRLSRCCSTTLIRDLTAGTFEFWEATCDIGCPTRSTESTRPAD